MLGRLSFSLSVCVVALFVIQARAQAQSRVEGAARIGFELTPVTLETTSTEVPGASDLTYTSSLVGITPSILGFSLAGVVGESVVLGARMNLGVGSNTTRGGGVGKSESSTTRLMLLPYIEALFGDPESTWRGAIGATFGFMSQAQKTGSSEASYQGGLIGLELGAHGFLSHDLSIDPGVLVAYEAGTSTTSIEFDDGFGGSSTSDDASSHGTLIMVRVGFSMWPGAEPPGAADDADEGRARRPQRNETRDYFVPTYARSPRQPSAPADPAAVSTTMNFGNDESLRVFAHMERWKSQVGFTFALQTYEPVAEGCTSVTLIVGDQVRQLPAQSRSKPMRGGHQGEVLVSLPYHEVNALAQAPSITFDVCGEQRTLAVRELVRVQAFLRRMEGLAARYHVDLAPPPEPAALPTEAAPAAPTEAPAPGSTAPASTAPAAAPAGAPAVVANEAAAPATTPEAAPAPQSKGKAAKKPATAPKAAPPSAAGAAGTTGAH